MMYKNIEFLMRSFQHDYIGHMPLEYTLTNLKNRVEFNFELVKDEFQLVVLDDKYNWVEKAIETKFVQKTSSFDKIERLDLDDIIIFIDSCRWKDIVKHDAWLTIEQKEELKESLRDFNLANYGSINDVLAEQDFDWLPFEVKHALIANFSNLNYTNDDIIYYLKSIIWDYLYPNAFDKERLSVIESEVENILMNNKENQGWFELNNFVSSMKNKYYDIDMFEISKVCTSSQYQNKLHFRNPFTLGFKRFIE